MVSFLEAAGKGAYAVLLQRKLERRVTCGKGISMS